MAGAFPSNAIAAVFAAVFKCIKMIFLHKNFDFLRQFSKPWIIVAAVIIPGKNCSLNRGYIGSELAAVIIHGLELRQFFYDE